MVTSIPIENSNTAVIVEWDTISDCDTYTLELVGESSLVSVQVHTEEF